jgi:hypothetical protein
MRHVLRFIKNKRQIKGAKLSNRKAGGEHRLKKIKKIAFLLLLVNVLAELGNFGFEGLLGSHFAG